MTTLKLRDEALADLEAIGEYGVAQFGLAAAEAYLRTIDAVVERLRQFPLSGRIREELASDVRSASAGQHYIFYRYAEDHVSVVRILHKSRDAEVWLS